VSIIEVEHLHKRYRDTVAVEDVSFTVARGEIFGIIGPNGAGKTTTVETIEGLRTPDRGTVRVLGTPTSPGGLGDHRGGPPVNQSLSEAGGPAWPRGRGRGRRGSACAGGAGPG
jgi:ABC-type oligopeptide transport system ATPase subunit